MILKFKENGKWFWVDGLSNISYKRTDQHKDLKEYMRKITAGERIKQDWEEEVNISNYVYLEMVEQIEDNYVLESTTNYHNGLTFDNLPLDYKEECITYYPSGVIICDSTGEFEKYVLVSNDEVYLLSDEGKTIERIQ